MTLAALLSVLKPLFPNIVLFLLGLIFPSPIERLFRVQKEVHDAETKATDSRGNVSHLDHLP